MCGIVGYLGKRDATSIGLKCLKKLEYRGYDSFGTCIKTKKGLFTLKRVGKIGQFQEYGLPEGNLAIFHSRWATHGGVTEANAHPHLSCNNDLAIVHNGIIENYQELKEELLKKKHVFRSETDTEVIVHLIEEYAKKVSIEKAVQGAIKRLEGSYALLVLDSKEEKLYAVRNQSPLVVGFGKDEIFVASDVPAFLEHTNQVLFLDDGDFMIIQKDKAERFNNGKKKSIAPITVELAKEGAEIGPYKHFMLKEIFEQGKTLASSINQERAKIELFEKELKRAESIILTACGTAYHAALTSSYHLAKNLKKYPNVILASELRNFMPAIDENTAILAVSQSGETADVLSGIKEAKEKGAKIFSIVNVMGSSLTRVSDYFLLTNCGPEIAVASTKAFTAQIALLYYLYANEKEQAAKDILETEKCVQQALTEKFCKEIEEACSRIKTPHLFIIGKGKNYPIALEAALKIKEISYLHAEGFAGGELKHGTLALIESGTPCIVFANKGEKDIISNAMEIKARGGMIIGISPEYNQEFDVFIRVPEAPLQELVFAIPAQLFAYFLGIKLKRDIDKPRNLAKSVTTK